MPGRTTLRRRKRFWLNVLRNALVGAAVTGSLWMWRPPAGCARTDFFTLCTESRWTQFAYAFAALIVASALGWLLEVRRARKRGSS